MRATWLTAANWRRRSWPPSSTPGISSAERAAEIIVWGMEPRVRQYDREELELFARYQGHRQSFRPRRCKNGEKCWVTYGPPAITSSGVCIGCREKPLGYRADGTKVDVEA